MADLIRMTARVCLLLLVCVSAAMAQPVESPASQTPPPDDGTSPAPPTTPTDPKDPVGLPEPPKDDLILGRFKDYYDALEAQTVVPVERPDQPVAMTFTRQLLRAFGWLCVIIAAILLLFYAIRRWGAKTPLLAGQRLAEVIGRVHLSPKASVHFVRTAGRVLVLGVTQQEVSLLTELDAATFDAHTADAVAAPRTRSFLEELQRDNARFDAPVAMPQKEKRIPDEEIDSLRQDLQRLQRYLAESEHETHP